MLLERLVEVSSSVAEVSGRREKIERLAAFLRQLAPDEVRVAISYLTGRLPQGRIGIGGSVVSRAAGAEPARTPTLTLHAVDEAFAAIATAAGPGSTARKVELLSGLISRATPPERDFLIRLVFGELRQGALEGVMLDAVGRAAGISLATLRSAVMAAGDLVAVARAALEEGERGVARFAVQLFRPVRPMLAESADDVEAAIQRLGAAALEYKLDGARIQVHKDGDEVRVFSRHLRDVTPAVPEAVEIVRAFPVRSAILDGEVIALREDGRPQPFQVTMQRFGRRLEVDRMRASLPLSPFFFDLLSLDGQSLLDESQTRRFDTLTSSVPPGVVVPHIVATRPDEARAFLDQAMRQGHEGVMAKARDASYAAGSRGQAWLKVKPTRTLDLVVLAAEWGHGRRKGWLSNLHLGARDPARGGFVMLGKTFKGLTDEMLEWQTAKFLAIEIGRDEYTVYLRPQVVVEIAFNDIQASPQYPGGVALRFARVKRYRRDKRPDEADTIGTVLEIFGAQNWNGA